MQVTLEAKAVATDKGQFTALAAAYTVDRVGDRIIPGAFSKTIDEWQSSTKQLPLHWNHESDPASIIGSVSPASLQETKDGLQVEGVLDLENSEKAREAWRAMKTGSMSLSFGFMVTKQSKAKDGVNDLEEIDLFEISVVPGPANNSTTFLSLKSIADVEDEINRLQKRLDELKAAATEEPPVEAVSEQTEPVPHQTADPEAERIEMERLSAFL